MNSKRESSNLDFLRTTAVMFVVVRHAMSALQFEGAGFFKPQFLGILGVLMFFVHTSLVLMFSLERQREKHGDRLLYSTFLIRRFFRIYPLSMAVVAAVFCLSIFWKNNPVNHTFLARDLTSNLFLFQNLTHSPNIIGPLWSLPIEVQMYLFLPLLFLCTHKIGARGFIWGIWPASVVIALTQYKFPLYISDVLKYAPCFIPGIICFTLSSKKSFVSFWCLPLLITACLLVYMILGPHSQTIGGYPICLALGLSLPFIKDMSNKTAKSICHTVAKYSYSIYLIHSICLGIVFSSWVPLATSLRLVIFITSTGFLSFLTYHLIESPMIAWGNKVVSRQRPRQAAPTQTELLIEEPTPVP